jgi:hypothetical protein
LKGRLKEVAGLAEKTKVRTQVSALLLLLIAVPSLAGAQAIPSPGTSADVDAAWSAFTQQWTKARVVNARTVGARGDAKVATDCGVAAGSFTLTCATDRFVPGDTDKPIVIYGAGAPFAAAARPLTTTIRRVTSARSVSLTAAAVSQVTKSPRVVWGTDDTEALQRAVDSVAASFINNGPGGVLDVPAGHYLVRELALPCARLGVFAQGTCNATYNRIWIRGAGRDRTTLENWDVETAAPAVITLGQRAEIPSAMPSNTRLSTIAISDLSVRQAPHTTRTSNAIWGYATEDVWIVNTAGSAPSYECYVMGGGVKSIRWRVHYNVVSGCGHGGPDYPGSTSALNMNGADWTASYNTVTDSLQAVEMGSRRGMLTDNVFVAPIRDAIGVNVGSTGSGIWENTIARNRILGFISAIEVFNSIGTVNRTSIVDNTIVNGVISVNSGQEENTVLEGDLDDVVHGTSIIRGNTLRFDINLGNQPIKIGTGPYGPQSGLENVHVIGNTVTYTAMHLEGGARAGQACTADADGGVCRLSGGFIALTYGGGPDYRGPKPMVVAADNTLRAPAGARSSGRDVAFYATPREALRLERLDANYKWETLESR